jgi:hypothetical protein
MMNVVITDLNNGSDSGCTGLSVGTRCLDLRYNRVISEPLVAVSFIYSILMTNVLFE